MKSVMSHQFSQVPSVKIERSVFDRSHGHKTTFDAGWLVPIFVDEALPGDTFSMNMTAFMRLATPIHPIMDNMIMDVHFFAVPNRLLWDKWKKFNGEQDTPGDSTDFIIPQVSATPYFLEGSVADYFGIPINVSGFTVSALPFRAYNLIYNQWYRDENLQNPAYISVSDATVGVSNYPLRRRAKRHDYFTSCLPWPQKGDSIDIPLGTFAPVVGIAGQAPTFKDAAGTPYNFLQTGAGTTPVNVNAATGLGGALYWDSQTALQADLSTATAATINQLRQAFQVQRLLERDARGGTRYTEIVRAHFGVVSPDARLQRPEFLGGGSVPIRISPVAQTSSTDATTPQGNLSAFGTGSGSGIGFSKSFTEHCTIIGIASVRADLTYQQGINRMWNRLTRYDFYWPALSHIGEQAVLNKEIYAQGTSADSDVFGYQERYAEYRYKPSIITGAFRSTAAASLDAWHLSQEFGSLPVLNSTFIEENPPIDRVIAVPTQPHFIFDSFMKLRCVRPMPVYGVPGLIDHF